MKPWFQPQARRDALWAAAKRWEGTPFFANAASRGHAVGCVNLANELFFEVGAIATRFEVPEYTLDAGHHTTQSALLRHLFDAPELRGRVVFVPFEAPWLPGDLLGVLSGHIDHHVACVLPWHKVIHATADNGAVIHEVERDQLLRRTLYILRLLDPISDLPSPISAAAAAPALP